jgi:hypothetical protein
VSNFSSSWTDSENMNMCVLFSQIYYSKIIFNYI